MVKRTKTVVAASSALYHHLILHRSLHSIQGEAEAGGRLLLNKMLSDILVCPLSKQPLRVCQEKSSHFLISDALGVSYPIVDGIPCLVPGDGKLLETDEDLETSASK